MKENTEEKKNHSQIKKREELIVKRKKDRKEGRKNSE